MLRKSLTALLVMLAGLSPGMAGGQRTRIDLAPAERAHLLDGMRTYLASIEDITSALAVFKPDRVATAARRSGTRALADVSPETMLKLPFEFTSLSLVTHQQFDALAERAERHVSRTELLGDLAAILSSCNGCHAAFRVK
jgi:cytochrome c556